MRFIKVKTFEEDNQLFPKKEHPTDAGYDLKSRKDAEVPAHSRMLIETGVFLNIPEEDADYLIEAQVRPRSGLALKKGITVLNTPGTIDTNYRGEVGVIIYNTTDEPFVIKKYDRIAQLVFNEIPKTMLEPTDQIEETDRGSGGFGSTGVN